MESAALVVWAALADQENPVELVVWAASAEQENPGELVAWAASADQENPAESAAWVAPEEWAVQVESVEPAVGSGNTIQVIAVTRLTVIEELRINLDKQTIVRALAHRIDPAARDRELAHRLGRPAEKAEVAILQRAGQVAVPNRPPDLPEGAIESVITPHHAAVTEMEIAAEDLVVAAEIMHAPAAHAVVAAWGVEDLVAVVAAAVVGAEVVGAEAEEEGAEAAEDVDAKPEMRNKTMKTKTNIMTSSKNFVIAAAIAACAVLVLATNGAEKKQTVAAAPASKPATSGQSQGKQFDTADQAADALIQVAASSDLAGAKEILGPDSEDILNSEDPVMDKNHALEFANKAKEKKSVQIDKKDPNLAILTVGNDDFPLPIPIVKQKGKWMFDTKMGREEILNRRVGANELNAIELCRGYVEAQHDYASEKHDDSKVNQYAQRILSTPGKHDGLAWQNADGTWGGPVGDEVAKALQEGYQAKPGPYHGYIFKVLKGQGPAAPMGEMDFVIEGAMIGGFALAAAPAEYRVTGVQTFMVGPDGVVYQKDLGKDTSKTFQSMDRYNPDKTWQETDDDEEDDSD